MLAGLEVLDTIGLSLEGWKLCEACGTFWEVCLMPEVHGEL